MDSLPLQSAIEAHLEHCRRGFALPRPVCVRELFLVLLHGAAPLGEDNISRGAILSPRR